MYETIATYIEELNGTSPTRPVVLDNIADKVLTELSGGQDIQLVFICTHNSRRSQLAQVWVQVLAHYFELPVETFSGGTEVTAFHPNALWILRNIGFKVEATDDANPVCQVHYANNEPPIKCYSKTFDNTGATPGGFIAVMTCSEADEDCPVVPGAKWRFSLPYRDPGKFDRSADPSSAYELTSKEIASEWYYILDRVKRRIGKGSL